MTSPHLISLDPSIHSCGVASWVDGRLHLAATLRAPLSGDGLVKRAASMADLVLAWAWDAIAAAAAAAMQGVSVWGTSWDLATEYPQAYAPGRPGSGPPNDLIPMALVIGAVGFAARGRVTEYLPRAWTRGLAKNKGGDPRDAPRGARAWSRLDPAERAVAEGCLQHDAWDAIGIGLHHLGRLAPRRGRKPTA